MKKTNKTKGKNEYFIKYREKGETKGAVYRAENATDAVEKMEGEFELLDVKLV
jgi:hypothetical protein|tara:strand:- start:16323 stop:16481 length:159 start_codon:yes stop_codon:yes gene_type:complete